MFSVDSRVPGRGSGWRAAARFAVRLALALASAAFLPPRAVEAADPPAITIGSGTTTGIYFAAASAVCRLLARPELALSDADGDPIGCVARFSKGSAQNVADLAAGRVRFALLQSDVQYLAFRGEGMFAGVGPAPSLRHVATLMPEALTVVARRDGPIHAAEDLFGRRVNLGQYGSGTLVIADLLAEVDPRVRTIRTVPDIRTALSAEALCLRGLDAFAFVAGHPNPLVQEAVARCDARLVAVRGRAIDTLIARYPFYRAMAIAPGLYPGVDLPVPTLGVDATLVAAADTPDELVFGVTRALYEGLAELTRLHLAFATLDGARLAAACNTAPLHPGAARYLQEAGIARGPC